MGVAGQTVISRRSASHIGAWSLLVCVDVQAANVSGFEAVRLE